MNYNNEKNNIDDINHFVEFIKPKLKVLNINFINNNDLKLYEYIKYTCYGISYEYGVHYDNIPKNTFTIFKDNLLFRISNIESKTKIIIYRDSVIYQCYAIILFIKYGYFTIIR